MKKLFSPFLYVSVGFILCIACQIFGAGAENIRLNQIGFYQYGPKTAIIVSSTAWRFAVKSQDLATTYFSGQLTKPKNWNSSGETVSIADFSQFTKPGTYVIDVNGLGTSYPFRIGPSVHSGLAHGLLKAFYYQRASTDLPEKYAGKWSRNEGHPDNKVIVHASAVSDSGVQNGRKEGEAYSSPKGWYDAGDYGKYVVNAGISTYQLLALYEQFSDFFDTFSLNIPRPIPALPDLLSEIKWEMDWILTMQDPADGGVYHKLTSLGFCGFIMPEADDAPRYFIGKGTAAAFDFAALCAVAARVYKKYEASLPGFSESCIAAAKRAWDWGILHPAKRFSNPGDVTTGEYGDGSFGDEKNWAANELYMATNDTVYGDAAKMTVASYPVPSWQNVSMLGMYSLAYLKNDSAAKDRILTRAKNLNTLAKDAPYRTLPYVGDFSWGSNSGGANYGMLLIEAFLITKDTAYFNRAVDVLDYLAGRNALGYCFVTGYGSKSPRHPHHRPSSADGVDDPVPGLLVGGPNASLKSGENTACGASAYPDDMPAAKSWIDGECSYASNEVAINWNAPAAFLAGALEAITQDPSFNIKTLFSDTLPPAIDSIAIASLCPDRVTITWTTNKSVSAFVRCAPDSAMTHARQKFSGGSTKHGVSITGLSPATRYYYQLTTIDDYGTITAGPELSFTTPESPVAGDFSFDPASLKLTPGSDLTVTFQAKTGSNAALIYAQGGNALTKRIACTESGGNYRATIPGGDVTPWGILLSIALKNGTDSITTQTWAVPASLPTTYIDTIPFTKAYTLLSLPSPAPIEKSADYFGAYLGDSSTWRYFGYDASSGDYVTNAFIGGGRGGWLYIAGNKRAISFDAPALKPDTILPIYLSRGWNCIGNPFPFPVFWENSLVRFNGNDMRLFDNGARQIIRRQLFQYSDTTGDGVNNGRYISNREILSADTTSLMPWRGYWVYAEKEGVALLINPAAEKPVMSMAKKSAKNNRQWQVRFSLRVGAATDDNAVIGESGEASDGYDEFDSPKPPVVSTEAVIGLLHPQWPCGQELLASDIAHYSDIGRDREWQMAACVKHGKGTAVVSWVGAGAVNGFLYLHDPVSGATIDMAKTNAYDFSLLPGETRRVMTVKKSAVKDARFSSVPGAWSVSRNSPNPFKNSTLITFSVPGLKAGEITARFVSISVFDVGGRRVRSLLKGYRFPGVHSVLWDGADDCRKRLRPGIYIMRICADGFSGAVRTHLID